MVEPRENHILLADVGGTNARFALAGAGGSVDDVGVLACADFSSLSDAALAYLKDTGAAPRRAAIAVASPVLGDKVRMTNRAWSFSIDGVKDRLGLDQLKV